MINEIYLILVVVFLCVGFIVHYVINDKYLSNYFNIVAAVFFAYIVSTRLHSVVYSDDIIRYYSAYKESLSVVFFDYLKLHTSREPGFKILTYIEGWLFGDITVSQYIFIKSLEFNAISFILYRMILKDVKSIKLKNIIILMLLCNIPFSVYSTQLVRQAIALQLFFISYLSFGKYKKFSVFIVSLSFHIIPLFIYLFLFVKRRYVNTNVKEYLVILSSIFLSFFVIRYLNDLFLFMSSYSQFISNKVYFLTQYVNTNNNLGTVYLVSIILILICFVKFNLNSKVKDVIFVFLVFIITVMNYSLLFDRFSSYLVIFSIISLSFVSSKNKNIEIIMILSILLTLIIDYINIVNLSSFTLFNGYFAS